MPRVKTSRFRPAPAALLQGTTEPRTQGGGVLGKTSLGKGETGQDGQRGWENVQNSRANAKVRC